MGVTRGFRLDVAALEFNRRQPPRDGSHLGDGLLRLEPADRQRALRRDCGARNDHLRLANE